MTHLVIHDYGGPDVFQLSKRPIQRPGKGQVVVNIAAAGVNLLDVWIREGMGRVSAVGSDVEALKIGDRVAWCFIPGSYSHQLLAPTSALVKVPDNITDHVAASIMMAGLTAYRFATEIYTIKTGDIALVHSAKSGFGLILTQIIQLLGGTVIGVELDISPKNMTQAVGADFVIVKNETSFLKEVMALTGGLGVDVVYDGLGSDTFHDSIAALRRHGVLACYGNSLNRLSQIHLLNPVSKSVLITYPTIKIPTMSHEVLVAQSRQLFDWVSQGKLKVNIEQTYSLEEAHRDIESGRVTNKFLFVP